MQAGVAGVFDEEGDEWGDAAIGKEIVEDGGGGHGAEDGLAVEEEQQAVGFGGMGGVAGRCVEPDAARVWFAAMHGWRRGIVIAAMNGRRTVERGEGEAEGFDVAGGDAGAWGEVGLRWGGGQFEQ